MSFLTSSRTLPHPVLSEPRHDGEASSAPDLSASQQLDRHLASAIAELSQDQTKAIPMTTASGSFVASLRAIMEEARAGLESARAEGLSQVKEAVTELEKAKAATVKVAATTAKTIKDEAASVMSELGQISNDLG